MFVVLLFLATFTAAVPSPHDTIAANCSIQHEIKRNNQLWKVIFSESNHCSRSCLIKDEYSSTNCMSFDPKLSYQRVKMDPDCTMRVWDGIGCRGNIVDDIMRISEVKFGGWSPGHRTNSMTPRDITFRNLAGIRVLPPQILVWSSSKTHSNRENSLRSSNRCFTCGIYSIQILKSTLKLLNTPKKKVFATEKFFQSQSFWFWKEWERGLFFLLQACSYTLV